MLLVQLNIRTVSYHEMESYVLGQLELLMNLLFDQSAGLSAQQHSEGDTTEKKNHQKMILVQKM